MRSPFTGMWGLPGIGLATRLSRYSVDSKAPAVVAAPAAGVYGINGGAVAFDALFSFSRLSAAWKRNALGHWVKVLAGEPRTGHHIWKDGVLVPAGMLMETSGSENLDTRSNYWTLGIISTNGGAIATNAALSPKGDMTAATITANGSPGSGIQAGIDVGGPDGRKFTGGASLRAGTVSEVKITLLVSGGGLGLTSKVVSLTSEWQELSHLIDLSGVTGGDYLRIRFTSDQEGTFEIYERLVQEGAVPRSHVPTDGSAIDVASESLQIDLVQLVQAAATPAAELVVNGGFDTESGWILGANTTISGGTISFNYTAFAGMAQQPILLKAGCLYRLRYDVTSYTSGLFRVYLGAYITGTATATSVDVFFTPPEDVTNISFQGSGSGFIGVVDNFSLMEIIMPDELTFLMKGTMSRAKDPVSYANAIPFLWQVDGGNYLDMIVSTYTTHTGRPYFRNRVAGTPQQVVVGPEDALDMGFEVPFSLGLVVGATELEGFLDGVSIGTVTHGGLANLLSVPLKLFPVGRATLEEFCIWAEALPSAAMLEATS